MSNFSYKPTGDMRPIYMGYVKMRGSGHRNMRGGAWYDDLYSGFKSVVSPVIDIAKKTGAVSKIATAFGQPEIAGVASALGFGKRKRRKARK